METKKRTLSIERREMTNIDNGKKWPQIMAIFVSCLTGITGGASFAWTSPSMPLITTNKDKNYDITEEEASYFSVLPPLAMMLTVALFSKLSDVIGRKRIILLIGVFYGTGFLMIANAKSVYVFYCARIITGLGDACFFTSLPMYVGEISTPEVRGSWGNLMTFLIYFGQFLINVVGSYFSIIQTAYIMLILPVCFLITFPFMPESPYFYIMKGKLQEARDTLKWLRRKNNVEDEFLKLKSDVDRQMTESGTWKDLFTIESNRKALYAGLFLRIAQQFGGIAVFAVYTQFIFSKSGGNLSSEASAMIFSGINCALNFVASRTLDKFGRKQSFFWSCLISGIILFVLSIYFYIEQQDQIDITYLNFLPITGMLLYVLSYSFGLGIIPTLMLGELFSASIKVKGLTALTIVFGILVSSITKLFYVLDSNFGLYCPFLLFSLSCFVSTFLTLYFVPETKGKTLEEIQQDLKRSKNIDIINTVNKK